MKRYPSSYEGPQTAPARCIELLERIAPEQGLLVDLGCGRAPLAEQVRKMGFDYVGVDVDHDALEEVSGRGFETHQLDLAAGEDELARGLSEIIAGRPVAALVMADLLEHLVHPDALLRALRGLGERASLIASVPNVTHLNVGAKVLLGRWDPTECGLLDDTHLRYFSEDTMLRLFSGTGWRLVDAADAENPDSPDQRFPADSPTLSPGTPARDLLSRLRSSGESHGATYQFVRCFQPDHSSTYPRFRWSVDPPEHHCFASVLVQNPDRGEAPPVRQLGDLKAQSVQDFETVLVSPGVQGWNRGIDTAKGRYLCFLDPTSRVSRDWIESFQDFSKTHGGRILMTRVVAVAPSRLDERQAEDVIGTGEPIQINSLDLLDLVRPDPTVMSAYAVPVDAVRAAGIRFEVEYGAAAPAVFLSRAAELSGLSPLPISTVAVSDGATPVGEEILTLVANSLDRNPMILPAGSATRILTLRRTVTRSIRWRVANQLRKVKRLLKGGRGSK